MQPISFAYLRVESSDFCSLHEASYYIAQSPKLEHLNRVVGIVEFDTDENGDWTLKIWEWK